MLATNLMSTQGLIFFDDCSSLTGWTNADTGSGATIQETFDSRSTFKFVADDGNARIFRTLSNIPNIYWMVYNLQPDDIGGSARDFEMKTYDGTYLLRVSVRNDGVYIYDGGAFVNVYSDTMEGSWWDIAFHVIGDGTVDTYINRSLVDSGGDMDLDATNDNVIDLEQSVPVTPVQTSYMNNILITRNKSW